MGVTLLREPGSVPVTPVPERFSVTRAGFTMVEGSVPDR